MIDVIYSFTTVNVHLCILPTSIIAVDLFLIAQSLFAWIGLFRAPWILCAAVFAKRSGPSDGRTFGRTDLRTDEWTDPLIEMRGRI